MSDPVPAAVEGLSGVVAIAAGFSHNCALLGDGGIRCWGNGESGRLGAGASPPSQAPVIPSGTLPRAISVAAGGHHTCAAFITGPVRCWGMNTFGQVGDGTQSTRETPTVVPGTDGAVEVAVGFFHSCTRLADGAGRCWGLNDVGQLGDGTRTDRMLAVPVSGVAFTALWTGNGRGNSCGVIAGTAHCWGGGAEGQLGNGAPDYDVMPVTPTGLQATTVAAGAYHNCAITTAGGVACWGGYDGYGSEGNLLGGGSATFAAPPAAVVLPAPVTKLATSLHHACAIAGGSIYCWGSNLYGQIGDGTTTNRPDPVPVAGVPSPTAIVTGVQHSCALSADGSVWCWGTNSSGQLGVPTVIPYDIKLVPSKIPNLEGVAALSASGLSTCAILTTGSVRCFGSVEYFPAGISLDQLAGATSLSIGHTYVCGLMTTGNVRCQGLVRTPPRPCDMLCPFEGTPAPAIVPNLSTATSLSASSSVACATSNGKVHCWGTVAPLAPSPYGPGWENGFDVPNIETATSVSVGESHGCATLADSTVRCWGFNAYGQLGDGIGKVELVPVPVMENVRLATSTAIAATAGSMGFGAAVPVEIMVAGAKQAGAVEIDAGLGTAFVIQSDKFGRVPSPGYGILPLPVGMHSIRARYLGDGRAAPSQTFSSAVTLTVTKGTQGLLIDNSMLLPEPLVFATLPITVRNTAGLLPVVTSTTPDACSVLTGSSSAAEASVPVPVTRFFIIKVHAMAGVCTIVATQQGDANFFAAAPVTRSFQVALAPTELEIDSDADGLPDILEGPLGRIVGTKDNDVFADARLFALQTYRDFLGREAEPEGTTYYANLIDGGAATRAQVVRSFLASAEFNNAFAPVIRLYFAFFNRVPDYQGLLFHANNRRLGQPLGLTSTGFTNSPEFQAMYGTLTNEQYVDLVYQNVLGRAPDPDGRAFYLGLLGSNTISRGDMMASFSASPEYQQLIATEVFVTGLYAGLLRRAPEPAGFSYYVTAIDRGADEIAVLAGFIASAEYRARFLP